ncbi:uncharacterized protein MONOS_2905 [Monocercomonoides exilis]|uniref:uncharacterized protein n=1 Tax=Monocercomonoides exilis TaxID=2049356 RepID=UPI003559729B|nr:hypothetical protein MONOS_2905 [Monocercomonoides exilis]|eukprot:MONOS_2905.1-p1 / transcript=MONOS_2905.1 / gene=MONOS_2905 / organism=Monocercomonoides_exilis_PA203 / gene_product=unspecified product / transcript_product=unspecified product / location=Mono_scaffold00063:124897-126277(+) / protein_length=389 / sequence_SO=supercontig / SO=protein_coding / is_pseudo=false
MTFSKYNSMDKAEDQLMNMEMCQLEFERHPSVFFETECVRTAVIEFAAYCITQVAHLTPAAIQTPNTYVSSPDHMGTPQSQSINAPSSPVMQKIPTEGSRNTLSPQTGTTPNASALSGEFSKHVSANFTPKSDATQPNSQSIQINDTHVYSSNLAEENKTQQAVTAFLCAIRYHSKLLTSELLVALSLIDALSRRHWQQGRFALNKDNVFLVILVTIMIAHKCSCDKPYTNGWWSRTFHAPLAMINGTEMLILQLLSYDVSIPAVVFHRYYTAIVEGCHQKTDLNPSPLALQPSHSNAQAIKPAPRSCGLPTQHLSVPSPTSSLLATAPRTSAETNISSLHNCPSSLNAPPQCFSGSQEANSYGCTENSTEQKMEIDTCQQGQSLPSFG